MKHIFVLDLSALMSEPQFALPLVSTIAENCHRIAMEYGQVWKAYRQRWGRFDTTVGKLLWDMLYDSDKFTVVLKPPHLSWEREIPREDRKFVRLAKAGGAILVTEDQPLIDTLRAKAQHGVKVMKCSEALKAAKKSGSTKS